MAWRRPREPARVEPPAWYRDFDPAMWDEPDAQEERMLAGCAVLGAEWVAGRHAMHAHRRWGEAKHRYRQEHPALAEQEFREIISGEWRAREDEKREREPEVHAWFVNDEIAPDDPLAPIKQRAAALWTAAEVLEQAARSGTVAARADRLGPVADLVGDESFTAEEVTDMGRGAGLSDDDLDAAANVAFELWTVEQLRK